jgi:hypothetical protein
VGAAVIGWAHGHGHDGTVKQVANTVQTSLQTGQRVKEVQDGVDRPYIYNYALYSAEYAAEASEGDP